MDTIGQRIKNLRIEYGYSQEELAEKLSLSRVAITKWESGQTANLKLDNIIGICKIFDISISYLITGDTSTKEKADKTAVIHFLNKPKSIQIPVFEAFGSMGEGAEQPDHDTITGELQLSESWAKENLKGASSYKNIAVITGKGDSMETTFHDGDVLFVDTGIKNFVTNGVYVFSVNNNLFIKRLSRKLDGEIIATCDNPAMQHLIERPGEHGYVIHGKVVGVWNWKKV